MFYTNNLNLGKNYFQTFFEKSIKPVTNLNVLVTLPNFSGIWDFLMYDGYDENDTKKLVHEYL